ncbi:MAG: YraN family protein [Patescibacteria group bacterium]
MKKFSSETQKKGKVGESIACKYLLKNGFDILERNYTRKWGEIDVIARKRGVFHFIEVKSVSCENFSQNLAIRPEDQMHARKQKKLARTIELYTNERGVGEWQFDVACVYMNMKLRKARVKLLENIILC